MVDVRTDRAPDISVGSVEKDKSRDEVCVSRGEKMDGWEECDDADVVVVVVLAGVAV